MPQEVLLELTTDIISAHVGNNLVSPDQLPELIQAVYGSLAKLGEDPEPAEEDRAPAVSIRASVKPDAIICLECGTRLKMLKRHLQSEHGLTPEDYRGRWNLAPSYPMISADYRSHRKAIAVDIGLGMKGGRRKKVDAKAETAAAPPAAESAKPTRRRKLGISAG